VDVAALCLQTLSAVADAINAVDGGATSQLNEGKLLKLAGDWPTRELTLLYLPHRRRWSDESFCPSTDFR
jgi:hypothetical protein